MTLPIEGSIGVSNVNTELGEAPTKSSALSWLNEKVKPTIRPTSPRMSAFYNLAWYHNNNEGNCANGNCTENCNCGNIQCTNCVITGGVDCVNCDTQPWLQNNCNCACSFNCTTGEVSYNCNCACNCSKIICTQLYKTGMMPKSIFDADQAYGEWLKKNDRQIYRGYIRWAKTITAYMKGESDSPDYMDWMIWIRDKDARIEAQKEFTTKMAFVIGTPWSQHMAWLMGVIPNDNPQGRIIMNIGRPICRIVYALPKRRLLPTFMSAWLMWSLFYFALYSSKALTYKPKTKFFSFRKA